MIVVQLATECYHLASTRHQTILKFHLFRSKFCELELALDSPGLLPMSSVVIFSLAGQLCSGHSLTASGGNLQGVRGGKSPGPCVSHHLNKLNCACSDGNDRVSSENVWGLLHLQSRLAQSCICYILFTKSSQEAASMQEEVSGARDCLMEVATVSQCNWVRTQEEEWLRLLNLPHLKLVSAKEHDMPTKNPFKNSP